MAALRNTVFVAGRIVAGGFFLQNGINHFRNVRQMTPYAESKGIQTPKVAVLGSGALLLAGGANLVTGRRPKVAVGALALFLTGVSLKMHAFWKIEDQEEKQMEQVNFMKNMGLLGSVLALAAVPEPWPVSLGQRRERKKAIADVAGGSDGRERTERSLIASGHS